VTVEIEHYSPDLSVFRFVALPGRLVQVEDAGQKRLVREMFVHLIKSKALSSNVLSALGHSPHEPVEVLLQEEKSSVWKLVGVKVDELLGLKSHSLYLSAHFSLLPSGISLLYSGAIPGFFHRKPLKPEVRNW